MKTLSTHRMFIFHLHWRANSGWLDDSIERDDGITNYLLGGETFKGFFRESSKLLNGTCEFRFCFDGLATKKFLMLHFILLKSLNYYIVINLLFRANCVLMQGNRFSKLRNRFARNLQGRRDKLKCLSTKRVREELGKSLPRWCKASRVWSVGWRNKSIPMETKALTT